jgi:hypothetical protein
MKKSLLLHLYLPLYLLLVSVCTYAQIDLYAGEVPVISQSEADRNQALPEALRQVLRKVTGLRELPATEELDGSLNSAASMLVSFRYGNTIQLDSAGNSSQQLQLVARFLPSEVDKLVLQNSLPRWPQQRPAVQLWVVVDDGLGRTLQPIAYQFAWQQLEAAANARGLPVIWPELDEEEQQLIDIGLIWGGFTDYLIEKGAPPDGVATVAAVREGPVWNLRWTLTSGLQNWNWRSVDTQLSSALVNGVEQMADEMARATSIQASEQGQWQLDITVSNLLSAQDYSRCLNYLQDVSLVTGVQVVGAEPGQVHFSLQLNAAPEYLIDAFRRGAVLGPSSMGDRYEFEYLR